MAPAKAQQTANYLAANTTPKEVNSVIDKIKSAKDAEDLTYIVKSAESEAPEVKAVDVPKPSGYQQLSLQQRADWNEYLRSLGDEAGSPNLDKGAPETEGMKKLKAYLAANPSSSLNKFKNPVDLVKSVQYEMNLIRKGKEFPGINPFELKAIQALLLKNRPKFMNINTSKEDGNPGQFTTQEYYPIFGSGGVDYAKSMNNVYKTLDTLHKIKSVDGKDITKLITR